MDRKMETASYLFGKETKEAGMKGESSEIIILTHAEAKAAIVKIADDVLRRVMNLDNGTWKTLNETPGTQTALTVEQLAEELHISRTRAYALVKQDGFPSFSVGRKVLVSRQGLQRWIEKGGTSDVEAC